MGRWGRQIRRTIDPPPKGLKRGEKIEQCDFYALRKARDNANLTIIWLADESPEKSDNLCCPHPNPGNHPRPRSRPQQYRKIARDLGLAEPEEFFFGSLPLP